MPIKVLFIEGRTSDHSSIANLLIKPQEISAQKPGFEVELIDSVERVSELVRTADFDVVLVDLQLSDTQGLETLEQMRPVLAEIPVVVFTKVEDNELAVRAVEMGAQESSLRRVFSRICSGIPI